MSGVWLENSPHKTTWSSILLTGLFLSIVLKHLDFQHDRLLADGDFIHTRMGIDQNRD